MCGITASWMKGRSRQGARAARKAAAMLRMLQHRGHEGAGACVSQGKGLPFLAVRGTGPVMDVLSDAVCNTLIGKAAVAQTRYSTAGEKNDPNPVRNLGPHYAETKYGNVAIVHNGNLKGSTALRRELKNSGVRFQTGTDTELFLQFIAQSKKGTLREAIVDALARIPIAYSFIVMGEEHLYAMRDPYGVRPLVLGENVDAYVLASETSAIEVSGSTVLRDIEPGELLEIGEEGLKSYRFAKRKTERPCIFENVYFARPDNLGGAVQDSRILAGRFLALKHPSPSGVVVGVPNSGLMAANGYAQQLGLPLTFGIVRHDNEGRAFMKPTMDAREVSVRFKHTVVRSAVNSKSVTLIDDSLVRGKTLERIIALLRAAGAVAVHVRIASPMVIHPCFFGIDTPSHDELFANQHPTEASMALQLRADSVEFLTLAELIESSKQATGQQTYCTMCFDGKQEKLLHAA